MGRLAFRIGQTVWIFNGDDYQKEKIVKYYEDTDEWEITDGNMYSEDSLFKTKKACALGT